jgi:2-polyprenyl-3-methyl-5-hydroxy-6-metoxy-1,4-benzoquinol methylase
MHPLSRLATMPFRYVPSSVRRRLVQLLTRAAAAGQPAAALRELLTMDADLAGQIDLASLEYGDGIHVKHRLMRYHDFFADRIHSGERVLDIGCGYGAVAHSIATRTGADVTGIDMNAANVQKAEGRFRHEHLAFVHGEAPAALGREHFDVIVLSNVLEHIEHRQKFLGEVQTRATPSRWLIRVPMFNRDWRPPLRQELGLYAYGDPTHYTEYTRESFETEMAGVGFRVDYLQVNWGEIWSEVSPRD